MRLSRLAASLALGVCLFMGSEANADPADPAFVVKPYLQIGSKPVVESLTVVWHAADSDSDWAVESRNAGESSWMKAAPVVFRRVAVEGVAPHRVVKSELAGLKRGGAFEYRILKGNDVVFHAEGHAPRSADQRHRLVIVGDCGAGTAEQLPLAARAHVENPDLFVITGDVVYERGLVSEYRERFWPIYNADEASPRGAPLMRSIPFVAAPGNHDTDTRDLDAFPDALAYHMFWDQPLNGPAGDEGSAFVPKLKASEARRKAFLDAAGPTYPRMTNFSFDYGNVHWTIVDSNPYVDWTDPELKAWLAKDLAAAQGADWRFVAFHHPGFNSAREHFEQQQMRLLAPIFEKGKVDVVFNGHVHNYQRSYPMTFVPDKQGTLLVGGREGNTLRGRVVNGRWRLDKKFDGRTDTTPEGVLYVVTGAGGQHLYNPEQNDDPDSWQKFTDKFLSTIHSITVADVDGRTLTVRQVTAEGKELDRFTVTK